MTGGLWMGKLPKEATTKLRSEGWVLQEEHPAGNMQVPEAGENLTTQWMERRPKSLQGSEHATTLGGEVRGRR